MTCTDITTHLYTWEANDNQPIESPSNTISSGVYTYSVVADGQPWEYWSYTVTYSPIGFPVTYNPCRPWLSVPTKIYTLQPEYSSCVHNIKGLFDPPIFLTTSSGFYPITTPAPPQPTPTKTAAPGSAIPELTPTKTPSLTTRPAPPPSQNPQAIQTPQVPSVATVGGTTIIVSSNSVLVAAIDGTSINVHTSPALIASMGGTIVPVTANSNSELVGTIGGSTITFTTNANSAVVGTFGGAAITASSQSELLGIIGSSSVTFTTNSESALVGMMGGSTITASTGSELIGTIGESTITFTTNSDSALVGRIGGSTVTARSGSTNTPGLRPTSAGGRSKSVPVRGLMLFLSGLPFVFAINFSLM
jgi:hypothetical protein